MNKVTSFPGKHPISNSLRVISFEEQSVMTPRSPLFKSAIVNLMLFRFILNQAKVIKDHLQVLSFNTFMSSKRVSIDFGSVPS